MFSNCNVHMVLLNMTFASGPHWGLRFFIPNKILGCDVACSRIASQVILNKSYLIMELIRTY